MRVPELLYLNWDKQTGRLDIWPLKSNGKSLQLNKIRRLLKSYATIAPIRGSNLLNLCIPHPPWNVLLWKVKTARCSAFFFLLQKCGISCALKGGGGEALEIFKSYIKSGTFIFSGISEGIKAVQMTQSSHKWEEFQVKEFCSMVPPNLRLWGSNYFGGTWFSY